MASNLHGEEEWGFEQWIALCYNQIYLAHWFLMSPMAHPNSTIYEWSLKARATNLVKGANTTWWSLGGV
jgi:hypothetical protein